MFLVEMFDDNKLECIREFAKTSVFSVERYKRISTIFKEKSVADV